MAVHDHNESAPHFHAQQLNKRGEAPPVHHSFPYIQRALSHVHPFYIHVAGPRPEGKKVDNTEGDSIEPIEAHNAENYANNCAAENNQIF